MWTVKMWEYDAVKNEVMLLPERLWQKTRTRGEATARAMIWRDGGGTAQVIEDRTGRLIAEYSPIVEVER